ESEVSGYGTLKSFFFFFFFLVPPWISVKRGAEPYSCRLLSTPQFLATQLPDPERIQTSPEKRREPANKAAVGPWAVWQPGSPPPRLSSRPSIERNPGPASRLQAWPLGPHCSPPHPAPAKPTPRATRVHAPSQLLLRAPTLLSPQPLAQPPRLGKTKPGGGGGPGLQERSPPRWPPLLPQRRWKQKEQKFQLTFGYEMTLR
ncbi:mCG146255, isoform CRA_b, partial [Mus musculus]